MPAASVFWTLQNAMSSLLFYNDAAAAAAATTGPTQPPV
jgi:hypothetical protein